MSRSLAVVCTATAAVLLFFIQVESVEGSMFTYVRDLISTSAKNAGTDHEIRFTVVTPIPASGQLEIRFHEGDFTIPADFDYEDIDIAVSSGGPYVERDLAPSASATDDGVSVTPGVKGSILVTLNSSGGMGTGDSVVVRLGTNASFDVTGDTQIFNPSITGSYRIAIESFDQMSVSLDLARAMIAIVEQVTTEAMSANTAPVRSNGLPSGAVAANNPAIEISLNTDEFATCRYATTTGVAYASMTGTFSPTVGMTFGRVIYNHQNSTGYNYYVRCSDVGGTTNDDDYAISFTLGATPDTNTSVGEDTGAGGPGGIGYFQGGSGFLYQSNLTVSGFAAPQSVVTILTDGKVFGTALANDEGRFQKTVTSLERGVYTMSAYYTDRAGRRSTSHSASLSLSQGTNNVLSNIVLPPTLGLNKKTVGFGETILISGEGIPESDIELLISKQNGKTLGTPKKYTAKVTKGGEGVLGGVWEVEVSSSQLAQGTHEVKARAVTSLKIPSVFSTVQFLGVGEDASPDFTTRADMNGDAKINLIDFSIMLTHWGTADPASDINLDGIVNLSDFSIMLFNWTG